MENKLSYIVDLFPKALVVVILEQSIYGSLTPETITSNEGNS